jgi:hypothetical protein
MIKRVAALPGDPLPPTVAAPLCAEPAATVPAGFLILLGDNAAESIDSRTMGLVPTDRVLGVLLCYFGKRARQPTVWPEPPVTHGSRASPSRRSCSCGPLFRDAWGRFALGHNCKIGATGDGWR